jgi:nitrogen-specific signal transduction histidine kinase
VIVAVPREGSADLQRALDAGADDYLTTPPSVRNVAARLSIAERRMRQAVARRRAERGLQRARWLAGIGETSIALQHEINNPLAALLGHAALLEEGLVAPDEEAEALQVVVEQAHRIASVMKRLAALRDPRSVAYLGGARMIDLSRPAAPAADAEPTDAQATHAGD